jgi:signal transduction histidine kinase
MQSSTARPPIRSSSSSVRANALDRLLVTLGRDQRVDSMPAKFDVLLTSVGTILANKPVIESKLEQLVGAPVGEHATALSTAAQDMYAIAVTRIEQARLMLAVYAVVLLLAVGFIALRLHGSYREINRANAELIRERLEPLREFIAACVSAFSIKSEDFADRAEYQARFVGALRDVKVLLRDGELDAAIEEIQDLTRDSIAGLGELTEMAQSLKDFSRLDRAPIASFDVNGGLEKTLLIAKNIVKHKATVNKMYGEIPEIECSPSQINQVFLNIITNAAQAIETTGDITIETKLYDPEHVAIRISDTGCGIPEENMSKIRDPFFTTKEVGTGTGLGLSIVDEIIRSHYGELQIESEVDKGSTFTVILPIKRPDSRESALAEALDLPELKEAV